MAPLTPHWPQPSHPAVQEVIHGADSEFTTKSVSRVHIAPQGLFAELSEPPCTFSSERTYATVQAGRDRHIMLNSDLLYINHSCEPSLLMDPGKMQLRVSERGLKPGDELTFFYPSTEWEMAQPFDCNCRTPSCRGRISGAKDMTEEQLSGYWLSRHIQDLKTEQSSRGAPTA